MFSFLKIFELEVSINKTHYLKLGSSKERIEKEILEKQKELIEAKTKNLNSNSEAKELYNKALEAFRRYSGAGGDNDEY